MHLIVSWITDIKTLSRVKPGIDTMILVLASIPLTKDVIIPVKAISCKSQGEIKSLAMNTLQIKSYRPGQVHSDCTMYILSKGNNAGKPLDKPCPNCFALTANTTSEKTNLYWICYMLWQGGIFRRYLIGSVIRFIRIDELRACIDHAIEACKADDTSLRHTIDSFEKISRVEQSLAAQLDQVRAIKSALARTLFVKAQL